MPRRSFSGAERYLISAPATSPASMHMSETLPENKTGRLRSVRGVHLPTVPREPRFHTTIQRSFPKYLYCIGTVMHHSMHVPYQSPSHHPRTKLLTLCSPNTSPVFLQPRHPAP